MPRGTPRSRRAAWGCAAPGDPSGWGSAELAGGDRCGCAIAGGSEAKHRRRDDAISGGSSLPGSNRRSRAPARGISPARPSLEGLNPTSGNSNINTAYVAAAGFVPPGAKQLTYEVGSVTLDASRPR